MAEAYVRWLDDDTVTGPFDSADTAEGWVRDNGGVDEDEYIIVPASEVKAGEATAPNVQTLTVTANVKVTGARSEAEALALIERAFELYNGESSEVGTLSPASP